MFYTVGDSRQFGACMYYIVVTSTSLLPRLSAVVELGVTLTEFFGIESWPLMGKNFLHVFLFFNPYLSLPVCL